MCKYGMVVKVSMLPAARVCAFKVHVKQVWKLAIMRMHIHLSERTKHETEMNSKVNTSLLHKNLALVSCDVFLLVLQELNSALRT